MEFKKWLRLEEDYQQLFPFMQEEEPPNLKRIARFKSKDAYVKAMQKGGKKTGDAAKAWIAMPVSNFHEERLVELVSKAVTIPEYTFPNGVTRPKRYLAFAHVETVRPVNPDSQEYNRRQYRILAFWQGDRETFDKSELYDSLTTPIGGLMGIGGYITHVWIDKEFRGWLRGVNLYKELMLFAKKRGIFDLAPEKATCPECGNTGIPLNRWDDVKPCPKCGTKVSTLTSKDFRATQAKYDWDRAQALKS